jgi:hypothetical protein
MGAALTRQSVGGRRSRHRLLRALNLSLQEREAFCSSRSTPRLPVGPDANERLRQKTDLGNAKSFI